MRKIIEINKDWRFLQKEVPMPESLPTDWPLVDLPHTWNAVDGHDGNGSGYDRGSYWYVREFDTPSQPLPGGRVYVQIHAAGQEAEVYVNGKKACEHAGGYSLFRADVTDLCREDGPNLLAVLCSNRERTGIYPQSADFTFYGGLYRGVDILSVAGTHFDLDFAGGDGFDVTASPHEDGPAEFELRSFITNPGPDYTVYYNIYDRDGQPVAGACRPSGSPDAGLLVPHAHLWSPDDPYLYTVTAQLQRRNEVVDEVTVRSGVRSFTVDPERGFILNGRPLPLRGVSRHQDRLYKGNALTREDHWEDARIIKELGANTIRLAHYQHSQDFYDACDELGFVVWAEIPFISVFDPSPEAHENCRSQLTELIVQNFNHPSICFWGVSNEILIGGISQQLVDNHRELNSLAHSLDPSRLTTIAHVSMTPEDSPLHDITDVESYNHYFGWYGGKMEDNGPWLDSYHKRHPERCLGVSEYGCEGIVTYHGPEPACKDYSEEYQALYHEHMAKVLSERPWLWSSHVWNMFDFGCAFRNEGGVSGRNNKGLVTMDRKTRKDSFYIYQAYWSKKPMVHIAGRRYAQRAGESTKVRVYSNQPSVSLYLNGSLYSECRGDKVFVFDVVLEEGMNTLVASAWGVRDSIMLEKVEKEPDIYVLPEVKDRAEGVANWFKLAGDLDLKAPMEFPEGKYNVKYTLEQLAKSPEALDTVNKALKAAVGMQVAPGAGIFWDVAKGKTPQDMCDVDGIPEGFVEGLNAQLIKIDLAK